LGSNGGNNGPKLSEIRGGEKAEKTHKAYRELAGGEDWMELNMFRKSSNIAQVVHARYKLARLEYT
jgi:hypothetical protein